MRRTTRAFIACMLASGVVLTGAGHVIAGETLDCTTDGRVYLPGQPVHIECTNHGDDFVVTGIRLLVTTANGGLVFNPAVPAMAVAVPPGESVEHTWDQTFINSPLGADGEQVPHGMYVVSVRNGSPARLRVGVQRHHSGFVFGNDDRRVDATASLIVWLDLMPVIPDLDDPVHALIDAEFSNLSNDAVRVEIESVTVRGTKRRNKRFAFLVEPPADWDDILEPGESSGGEWTKTDLIAARALECDAEVVGLLRIAIRSIDDEADEDDESHDEKVFFLATEPTTLSCVY